ncbi:MAG: hypothetical protein V4642_11885 [Bacteroidota bacterium]
MNAQLELKDEMPFYHIKIFFIDFKKYEEEFIPLANSAYQGDYKLFHQTLKNMIADLDSMPTSVNNTDSVRLYYEAMREKIFPNRYSKRLFRETFDSLYAKELLSVKQICHTTIQDIEQNKPIDDLNSAVDYSLHFLCKPNSNKYWFLYRYEESIYLSWFIEYIGNQDNDIGELFFENWQPQYVESYLVETNFFRNAYNVLYFEMKPELAELLKNKLQKIEYLQNDKFSKEVFELQKTTLLSTFKKAQDADFRIFLFNDDCSLP